MLFFLYFAHPLFISFIFFGRDSVAEFQYSCFEIKNHRVDEAKEKKIRKRKEKYNSKQERAARTRLVPNTEPEPKIRIKKKEE